MNAGSNIGKTFELDNFKLHDVTDIPIDAAAQAYFDTIPLQIGFDRLTLISNLVTSLKAGGAWTALDWLVLNANQTTTAARRNLRNPAKQLTLINSPTFTTDRGFTGDGASSYLSLGETLQAGGNNLSQNSATIGLWVNATSARASALLGPLSGSQRTTFIINVSDNWRSRMNGINDITHSGAPGHLGHKTVVRANATEQRMFSGSGAAEVFAADSSDLSSQSAIFLGAAGILFTTARIAALYSGGAITDGQRAVLHTALETYLTSIGAT